MAQPEPVTAIKTGDKLVFENFRYEARGREFVEVGATQITAEAEVSPEGRSYTYSNKRVEKFDAKNTLVEQTVSRKLERVAEDRLLKWMPDGKDFKSPRKLKETFQAAQVCGTPTGTAEYVATPREVMHKVVLAGKEVEVKAIEFLFEGRWFAGNCGSGRQVRKITYAPDLDVVLQSDRLNYLPSGGFLNSGSGWRLKSIN